MEADDVDDAQRGDGDGGEPHDDGHPEEGVPAGTLRCSATLETRALRSSLWLCRTTARKSERARENARPPVALQRVAVPHDSQEHSCTKREDGKREKERDNARPPVALERVAVPHDRQQVREEDRGREQHKEDVHHDEAVANEGLFVWP